MQDDNQCDALAIMPLCSVLPQAVYVLYVSLTTEKPRNKAIASLESTESLVNGDTIVLPYMLGHFPANGLKHFNLSLSLIFKGS